MEGASIAIPVDGGAAGPQISTARRTDLVGRSDSPADFQDQWVIGAAVGRTS
jgi:hypothetical protein